MKLVFTEKRINDGGWLLGIFQENVNFIVCWFDKEEKGCRLCVSTEKNCKIFINGIVAGWKGK